jgi:aspartate/methionine/tyrosine aminotransferase
MSDEVYEFLTFDDHKHIPFASLKINGVSLKERTITLSSAGKTFGLTGWKVGWATSSTKIIDALHKIHQYNTFCVNQPMQHAYATALNEMSNYLKNFKKTYLEKRDLLLTGLENAGFKSTPPQGTYFIMVPISQNTELNDVDYCRFLIEEKGLATIPPSAFYLNSNDGDKYLRFCFAKKNQTLIEACNRLKN